MKILALVLVAACGSSKPPTTPVTPPPPPDAQSAPIIGIALEITPPGAEVSIDDADPVKASTLAKVVPLPPGLHTVVITADGYKPYRAELTVSDKTETFTVRLDKRR